MPTDHYFLPHPSASGKRRSFTATLHGHEVRLTTETGVFSRERVDPGTRLLIENLKIGPGERLLDLGCGYGVVGIVAALLALDAHVTLVDINERAVELARANLRANNIENAEVLQGDGFTPLAQRTFDAIALNPPIRAGLSVVHRLIEESQHHLSPGGRFYLVGRTRQGAVRLAQKMTAVFGEVEELAKRSGYRLYLSYRR